MSEKGASTSDPSIGHVSESALGNKKALRGRGIHRTLARARIRLGWCRGNLILFRPHTHTSLSQHGFCALDEIS